MRIIVETKKIKVRNGLGEFEVEKPIAEVVVAEIAGCLNVVFKHSRFGVMAWFPAVVDKDSKVDIPKKYVKLFDPQVFPEVVGQ